MKKKKLFYFIRLIILSSTAFCFPIQLIAAPYAPSDLIQSVQYDWSTHIRLAAGSDNFPLTWADDDNQYTSYGDGGGFNDPSHSTSNRVSLGVARIEGPVNSYNAFNVWGGANAENTATFEGKSYGIISIGGIFYKWVSPGSDTSGYIEQRLYKSLDHGASWTAANWAFVKNDGLVNPTFNQFGKDYNGARDNYVYIYANHIKDSSRLAVQIPGEIALIRVDKNSIMDRNQYEFFAGFNNNNPIWTFDITSRVPVFSDSNGVGWNTSVTYNAGLGRYILITEFTETFQSNMGIHDAKEPWGPWTTVYYGKFGTGEITMDNFFYNYSNKWASTDGRKFVLIFTGTGYNDSWNSIEGTFTLKSSAPPLVPTGESMQINSK